MPLSVRRGVTALLSPSGMPERQERVRAEDARGVLRKLFAYLGRNRTLLIWILILSVVTTLLNLFVPYLIGRAVDEVEVRAGLVFDLRRLVMTLLVLAGVLIAAALLSYFQGVAAARMTQNVALQIRGDLSGKVTRLPIPYLDSHRNGDVMSRLTNDTDNIASALSQTAGALLSSVVVIVGCTVIMLIENWRLTLICLSTVVLSALLTALLSAAMRRLFQRQQQLVGRLSGQIQESVAAHKTVQAYGMVDDCIAQTEAISDDLEQTACRLQVLGALISPLTSLLGNLNFLLIVIVGGLFCMRGLYGVSIGMIQAFALYSRQFTRPVNELAGLFAQFQTSLASAERVFELLDTPDESDEGTVIPDYHAMKGSVRFEDICFSYLPGVPVLEHFSAEIRGGQRVALVGMTGAGKTTLVSLLMRFYEPDSGRILLDGTDIREIPKETLRKCVTLVLQNTSLMEDTVAANIGYGRFGASRAQLEEAAKTACADGFIRQLPMGYDTEIVSQDSLLSQGQRQLICLARAALKSQKLLILDEAMSSVDTATEQQIQHTMQTLTRDQTSLIIAHRLSTIRDADHILVLEGGRVVEQGTHEQLFSRRGVYYRLYRSNQYQET